MPSSNKIFLLTAHNKTYQELFLQRNLPDLELTDQTDDADIVLADPPLLAPRLNEFSQLDWVQSTFAGINALIQPQYRQDYQLTNIRDIFGPLIAEYVIGYTLNYYRHFDRYTQQQQQKRWQPHFYQSVQGKKIVILGTGSIGNTLARQCKGMGMIPLGVNRTGIPTNNSEFKQTFHINQLALAFEQADIVVNTLPSTAQTYHLLNEDNLCHLNNALFFNVGRGDALDNISLANALKQQWIAHAYLDVFEQEPLPESHPFWGLSQITITPHIAALSFPEQVFDIFADNYLRWRDGFKLQYLIDFDKGY